MGNEPGLHPLEEEDWDELVAWIESLPSGPDVPCYKCSQCGRTYRKESALAKHLFRYHPSPPLMNFLFE